jgi:hypothetical protein
VRRVGPQLGAVIGEVRVLDAVQRLVTSSGDSKGRSSLPQFGSPLEYWTGESQTQKGGCSMYGSLGRGGITVVGAWVAAGNATTGTWPVTLLFVLALLLMSTGLVVWNVNRRRRT